MERIFPSSTSIWLKLLVGFLENIKETIPCFKNTYQVDLEENPPKSTKVAVYAKL
jgi:hypothetical protein